MPERICLIGLDEPEYTEIQQHLGDDFQVIAHEILPLMKVQEGRLLVESSGRPRFKAVSKVVFHGIFENDLDFIAGLALWGGSCLPNARAMLDCRLKFPCLVRALPHTRFGLPLRDYVSPGTTYFSDNPDKEFVAKWGNWHCGENKARFRDSWTTEQPAIIEHFLPGEAVRIMIIGEQHWQIRLTGNDWLKSLHHGKATLMDVDTELLEDTRNIQKAFGLEIIGNDYMVTDKGSRHLLEVNHIPNVTRFPEIWQAYRDYVIKWIKNSPHQS